MSPAGSAVAGRRPRLISLVPNATEILFALGAGELVVAVSHECDYPPAARLLPRLTASALPAGLTAAEVDGAVSAQLASGRSLYRLDDHALAELAPDIIFTQELCPVCAVATEQVSAAVGPLPCCPDVVALDPHTLDDVLADIARVGSLLGLDAAAGELCAHLARRLSAVRGAMPDAPRLRVLALEWLDPPFAGGHWVPDMIATAGGEDCAARPGDPSRRLTWAEVAALDPDVVVAMPCGFDAGGAAEQVRAIAERAEWKSLRAVREGRVFTVDANGCFSRPGPRLVDGIERLAELLHASATTAQGGAAEGPGIAGR